jgi:hypothetical protein
MVNVDWKDEWPVFNQGDPVLLSRQIKPEVGPRQVPRQWVDDFSRAKLDSSWYQLRVPYTKNYKLEKGKLVLKPNVFGLSDRDTPAALLRKQKSLNMTFSAELSSFKGDLGPRNKIGISSYLSEFQHQDIGIRGCVNATSICLYTELNKNGTQEVSCHFQGIRESIANCDSIGKLHSTKRAAWLVVLGYTSRLNPLNTD